ncbi:MAG: PSD1 domain-containing protein [Planctomycetes bacterium]|nr:PSD1 domain-containing protein [Planctomycetota bacterium]
MLPALPTPPPKLARRTAASPAALAAAALAILAGAAAARAAPVDFNREVRPILAEKCLKCHGPDSKERKAGLRLDARDGALRPLKSGRTAIAPGKPAESELVRRVRSEDPSFRMPPPEAQKTLSEAEAATLERWIAEGAAYREHWAFVRPARPPLPAVGDAAGERGAWPRNEIDLFILERLEAEGLAPSSEADPVTLVRRATLDSTGLPPSPEEVDAFLADPSPEAYERLVDRLLASPRHGERMAVEWLDAARFADTHGYHIDSGRDMTLWRDWVIGAFNRGMPFDRFTVEQVAGDLLPGASLESQIASGFHRNHMINFEGGAIPEEYLNAYIVDRVNTTGTVWLGMTVGCGQCHDHKYDPLTQREFYGLYAFFHNVPENGLDGQKGNAAPVIQAPSPEQREAIARLDREVAEAAARLEAALPEIDAAQARWEAEARAAASTGAASSLLEKVLAALRAEPAKRSDDERKEIARHFRANHSPAYAELDGRLAALRKERAEVEKRVPTAMVMREMEKPRDTFLLVRGQYDKRGEKVPAGVPAFLHPLPEGAPASRLGLARWLVSPENPLTARVVANRYWQMYFGTGLVRTSEDFGTRGEPPSHPELLDWLATRLQDGWDVKALQRLILLSATYRQSSAAGRAVIERDPENRLLARGPRIRLQAEVIRDQALAASGLIDSRIGGHSVSPYQPPGLWEELAYREDGANWTAQTYVQSHGADLYRRTLYTFWKRTSPPPTLVTFDAPDRETCTVRRPRTNTPLQALILMNDPTYVEASRVLAERLFAEAGAEPVGRIALAYRLVLARLPSEAEVRVLSGLLEAELAAYRADPQAALKLLSVGEAPRDERLDPAELAAWTMVASAILNLDEAVTKV